MRRRIQCFFLIALLIATAIPQMAWGDAYLFEPETISQAAVLMDADSGQIIYGKNMNDTMYPASITKILTGYLALKYGDPADVLTLSDQVVKQVPRTSSHIGLLPGETISLKDALYALAVSSANDAAIAIAEHISGSVEAFADLMNREAEAMGAVGSHFVNPNGMPAEDHYTTAWDMALITAEALKMPEFIVYFGATEYEIPKTNLSEARPLVSKNKFIDAEMECPGLLISKTGWTSSALGTLVTAAERGGTTLIAVVMKSPMLEDKYADTDVLYRYGFESFRRTKLTRSFMEEKMRELGMKQNGYLMGYEPLDVLLPVSTKPEEIRLTVPGGFDAASGVSTVPVSVDVPGVRGEWLHITDALLTIAEAESPPKSVSREVQETSEGSGIHPGVLILSGMAALFLLLRIIAKKKAYV